MSMTQIYQLKTPRALLAVGDKRQCMCMQGDNLGLQELQSGILISEA